MKKILLVLPVILLVAAGCNSSTSVETTQPPVAKQPVQSAPKTPTPTPTPTTPPSAAGITGISITASPSIITLGQQTQIQWGAEGATGCTMSESGVKGNASDVSAPQGGVYRTPTTVGVITYTIVCKNASGASKTLSAKITVNPAVTPSPTQSAAGNLSITSTFAAGSSENVTAGATNVKLQSYTLSNPNSQSITVGQFYLNVIGSGASTFAIQNLKASVNDTLFTNGSVSKFAKPTNYLVHFMGSSTNTLVIPAGGKVTIDIYGDISSLPVGTSANLSLVTCNNGYDLTFNYCANAPQAINLVITQ